MTCRYCGNEVNEGAKFCPFCGAANREPENLAPPAPEEPPYVTAGAQVKKGDTLCLIEAMKMMSEVPAPADCVVEEVLARDGEAVGVGAPLFRVRRL